VFAPRRRTPPRLRIQGRLTCVHGVS